MSIRKRSEAELRENCTARDVTGASCQYPECGCFDAVEYDDVRQMIDNIRPILAGHDPEIIAAVLAELVAMLFAGHHPSLRKKLMALWIAAMKDLIRPNERIILEQYDGVWPTEQ